MGKKITISYSEECDTFDKLKERCPKGMAFSKFIEFVCKDWLSRVDLTTAVLDDYKPGDEAPLDVWQSWVDTHDYEDLKHILRKRRSINTLMEVRLFD
jgi:hypothetical protein